MSEQVRIPKPVYNEAKNIKKEYDYPSIGEAIRHVFQDSGHDV